MKRKLSILAASILAAGACAAWAFSVGSTRDEVVAELGQPTGSSKKGGKEFLYYGGGMVEFQSGKVTRADGAVTEYMTKRAQGLVQVDGKWVTAAQKKEIDAQKAAQAKIGPKIKIVAQGGKKVNIEDLVVPGKITIVDFYADWCGPCRAMAPYLEEMATSDGEVYLRKVDIVKFGSEVATQYKLDSIPNVRVFDRRGKLVGSPTYEYDEVLKYVERAKR